MQDSTTGELKALKESFFNGIPIGNTAEMTVALQKAKDHAQPNRAMQGAVFQVGDIVTIKGGKFKIVYIKKGRMTVEGTI